MKDDKRFVDIDHANKQLSRLCRNPNQARRQAIQHEAATSVVPPRVALLDKEAGEKREPS